MILTPHNTLAAQLSLKQLSYLLAVAHTLHFTRAAEHCQVSQSTLSGGLMELERSLGVQLVERNRHHVSLTPVGQQVAQHAAFVLGAAGDLVSIAKTSVNPSMGSFAVGLVPTVAPFVLPKALRQATKRFPHLALSITEHETTQLVAGVQSGELDAALVALPAHTGQLQAQHLFDDPLCLVASPSDPLCQRKSPISLQRIDPQRLVLLQSGQCLRSHTVAACQHVNVSASGSEATHLHTLLQLVQAGQGVALVPQMAVDAGWVKQHKLAMLPVRGPQPARRIAWLTRPTHPHAAFLQAQLVALFSEPTGSGKVTIR